MFALFPERHQAFVIDKNAQVTEVCRQFIAIEAAFGPVLVDKRAQVIERCLGLSSLWKDMTSDDSSSKRAQVTEPDIHLHSSESWRAVVSALCGLLSSGDWDYER